MNSGDLVVVSNIRGDRFVGRLTVMDDKSVRIKDAVRRVPWWQFWRLDFNVYAFVDIPVHSIVFTATAMGTAWVPWYDNLIAGVPAVRRV